MATEQEFYDFYNSLAPYEQRKFAGTFGGTEENLDDDSAFSDDPYANMPTQLAGVGAPQQDLVSTLLGQMAGGAYPQYTSAGKLDPLDLSQLQQRLNYTQDMGGSMFDVAQALFAGPDAFGNPEQFAPITRYSGQAVPASQGADGSPMPVTKSSVLLDDAIRMGGYRGFLAEAVKGGMDASAAVAAMRDLVTNAPNATNLDQKTKDRIKDIRNTLGLWHTTDVEGKRVPVQRETATWENFDEDDAVKVAQGFYDQKLTDTLAASTLQYDPQSGQFYPNKETEDSPAAKKFRDAGLPLPGESYTDPGRMQALTDTVDPNNQLNYQGYEAGNQNRAASLEEQRLKLLKNQLELQDWDQQLKGMSTPGAAPPIPKPAPAARPQQPPLIPPTANGPLQGPYGGGALPPGFSSQTQAGAPQMGQRPLAVQPPGGGLPPGFSSQTQAGAPTVGSIPNGPWTGKGLPPGFTSQTQANAPTLQGVDQRGQPHVSLGRTVLDSFGNPRTTTDQSFNFDLANVIFGNIPKTGAGVKKDQRLQNRNAPAQRAQNLKDQQAWQDQYNKNWAAEHRRVSTSSESNADQMAGAARFRATQSNPLQDTLLARLLSLTNRAGV